MIRAHQKEDKILSEYSNNRNWLMSKTRAILEQLGKHQFGLSQLHFPFVVIFYKMGIFVVQ